MAESFVSKAGLILEAINRSGKILLHLHPSPDQDSIGSALAFDHFLKMQGKDSTVIGGDSDLPERYKILPGFENITPKNFFEIGLNDFDLFIVLDSSAPNMISRLGNIDLPLAKPLIVIDHHKTNAGYGQINLIDPAAPATAAIIFLLFKEWKIKLTPAIAINLLVAIYGDTGGFRWPITTPATLAMAAELSLLYPDFPRVLNFIASQNSPGQLRFKGLAYNSIQSIAGDRAAYISLTHDQLVKNNLTEKDVENQNLATNLISVNNWLIGVSLIEKKPSQVYISCRSQNGKKYDVSKLAQLFGGGGHQAAAGAVFLGNINQAEKILRDGIKEFYPNLSDSFSKS